MTQNQEFDLTDVFNLELQLKEKMNELQWKSKALEQSQQELLQTRQNLLYKDIILEDTRRSINDLKMQLTTANEVIEWLKAESSKIANEKVQLQINCDTSLKERQSLFNQVHTTKLENMTLKLEVQKLTETVSANESVKKTLEASLKELQERFSRVNSSLQSNIIKLEKEHQLLIKSVESTVQLNKRLQTVGLCTHAIYTKKNQEIEDLKKELFSKTNTDTIPPQYNVDEVICNYRSKFDAEAVFEEIRMGIEKDNEANREINDILANLEYDC